MEYILIISVLIKSPGKEIRACTLALTLVIEGAEFLLYQKQDIKWYGYIIHINLTNYNTVITKSSTI